MLKKKMYATGMVLAVGCGEIPDKEDVPHMATKNVMKSESGQDLDQVNSFLPGKRRDPQISPLYLTPLKDLHKEVAPEFKAEKVKSFRLYEMLMEAAQIFSYDGNFDHFRDPSQVGLSEESDPDLEKGGTCKALDIPLEILSWDSVWNGLGLQEMGNTIRYGVHATKSPKGYSREKLEVLHDKASLAYSEFNNHDDEYAYQSSFHYEIGKQGDLLLVYKDGVDRVHERDDLDAAYAKRCLYLYDLKSRALKSRCSYGSYDLDFRPWREETRIDETHIEGKVAFRKIEIGHRPEGSITSLIQTRQTGENKAHFIHDFRDEHALDGAIFWGIVSTPYAFAEGDVEFEMKDEKPVDCKVIRVKVNER